MSELRYYVHSPGNAVAGGCESLHQLCDAINNLDNKAFMCYYPYQESFDVPAKFAHYNVSAARLEDEEHTVHIFPEVCTKHSEHITKGMKCIFWLSVDNYYFKKDSYTRWVQFKKYYRSLLTSRIPLHAMKECVHLLQSEYSKEHLSNEQVESLFIGDYIFNSGSQPANISKKARILYNPAKGKHITDSLKKRYVDLDFFPLSGFSADDLIDVMDDSLIYIDFGNHPGRDRLPREAVLRGVVIITGLRGSAKNDIDIPIPTANKLDTTSESFEIDFKRLIDQILENPSKAQSEMQSYRDVVINDKRAHKRNVMAFIEYCKHRALRHKRVTST